MSRTYSYLNDMKGSFVKHKHSDGKNPEFSRSPRNFIEIFFKILFFREVRLVLGGVKEDWISARTRFFREKSIFLPQDLILAGLPETRRPVFFPSTLFL